MKLPFFIASRYLFSKRKKNFINIISIISVIVVSIITAALIIVLSVFNGLGELLRTLNNSFDPEIKVEAKTGKSFEVTPAFLQSIKDVPGVEIVTEVIEDYAYVRYRMANQVVTIKGVSENFLDQHRIDDAIVEGDLALKKGHTNFALIGQGLDYTLSVNLTDPTQALHLFYIKNVQAGSLDPSTMYSQKSILPGAVFSIVQNFDDNYIIVPLDFARELLNYGSKRTSLEIKTASNANTEAVEKQLAQLLGDRFSVLNHEEQHKDLYKLLKMEKLFSFIALALLLAIGSINIFFTLMMLAMDKKRDISILGAMGASLQTIRNIFLLEGILIAILGTTLGLAIGGTLCWLQSSFGLISMGMQSAVTDSYPVKLAFDDFLYVLIVMFFITFMISYRPATMAMRFSGVQNL